MNLLPITQRNLYGLDDYLLEFIKLYNKGNLPNKILLSGERGMGKSTLSYHLINYVLSKEEEFKYDIKKFEINSENRSFKLITNGSNPNYTLIDTLMEKKNIDVNQIRDLISNLNKSSFNNKERFVLIDNVENLNINSTNALLKILEEPPQNTYFILINNGRSISSTLKSRCINYKIFLNYESIIHVTNKLLNNDIFELMNIDLFNNYSSPGKLFNLITFFKSSNYDLKEYKLDDFLRLIFKENLYKKNLFVKNLTLEYLELFLRNKISSFKLDTFNFYSYFIKRINDTKVFNLDEESLFIEFENKVLNG